MKILLLLFMPMAFASETISYEIGESTVLFHKEDKYLVSRSCEKKCQAYTQSVKHKDKSVSAKDRLGGKNPASVRCTKILEGNVVFGQDRSGNQQSFCVFSDKSYLLNQ